MTSIIFKTAAQTVESLAPSGSLAVGILTRHSDSEAVFNNDAGPVKLAPHGQRARREAYSSVIPLNGSFLVLNPDGFVVLTGLTGYSCNARGKLLKQKTLMGELSREASDSSSRQPTVMSSPLVHISWHTLPSALVLGR